VPAAGRRRRRPCRSSRLREMAERARPVGRAGSVARAAWADWPDVARATRAPEIRIAPAARAATTRRARASSASRTARAATSRTSASRRPASAVRLVRSAHPAPSGTVGRAPPCRVKPDSRASRPFAGDPACSRRVTLATHRASAAPDFSAFRAPIHALASVPVRHRCQKARIVALRLSAPRRTRAAGPVVARPILLGPAGHRRRSAIPVARVATA
jgi:hypothetical protein